MDEAQTEQRCQDMVKDTDRGKMKGMKGKCESLECVSMSKEKRKEIDEEKNEKEVRRWMEGIGERKLNVASFEGKEGER